MALDKTIDKKLESVLRKIKDGGPPVRVRWHNDERGSYEPSDDEPDFEVQPALFEEYTRALQLVRSLERRLEAEGKAVSEWAGHRTR